MKKLILKGAFYPSLLKMANYKTQIDFKCDPEVLRHFSAAFILRDHAESEILNIFEMHEDEWKLTEEKWKAAAARARETRPDLH